MRISLMIAFAHSPLSLPDFKQPSQQYAFNVDRFRSANAHSSNRSAHFLLDAYSCPKPFRSKEPLGVSDIEFHTFDDGKGKNYEDKAVSLLRLEEYAEHIDDSDIDAVKRLVRIKPQLAQGELI